MNHIKGKEIYNELILGKYINKDIYSVENDSLISNPLFIELSTNFNDYFDTYEKIGFTLIEEAEYFYLIDEANNTDENYINKVQLKEYVLLISIIRYLIDHNISIDKIINPKYGIQSSEIEPIFETDQYLKLFEMTEINTKKPLQDVLVKNNIIFLNKNKNYCLTNVGKSFVELLHSEGKSIYQDEEIE